MVRFCFREKRRRREEEREERRKDRKKSRKDGGWGRGCEGRKVLREGGSKERRETARDMCALDCSQCVSELRRNWLHQAETPYCGHMLHEEEAKVPDSHF